MKIKVFIGLSTLPLQKLVFFFFLINGSNCIEKKQRHKRPSQGQPRNRPTKTKPFTGNTDRAPGVQQTKNTEMGNNPAPQNRTDTSNETEQTKKLVNISN